MIVYLNGDYLPKEEARISPDDRGFLFADGVYEVLHAYDGHLFRRDDHRARLERSLRALRIPEATALLLDDVPAKLLKINDLKQGSAVIYVQVTRGAAPRKHTFPKDAPPPTVYAFAYAHTVPYAKQEQGVPVILVPDIRWTRCDIKSVALLPNILASQQAEECGVEEAVFVRDGMITEGSRTNVFAAFDGRLFTYPRCPYILGGITRQVVLELCRSMQLPVTEQPILERNVYDADEVFLCSTTSEILPIVTINDRTIGNGRPGPITTSLLQAFRPLTLAHVESIDLDS